MRCRSSRARSNATRSEPRRTPAGRFAQIVRRGLQIATTATLAKLERGEFSHAGGDAKCADCGRPYFDHDALALPPGSGWFAVACDGRLLKL